MPPSRSASPPRCGRRNTGLIGCAAVDGERGDGRQERNPPHPERRPRALFKRAVSGLRRCARDGGRMGEVAGLGKPARNGFARRVAHPELHRPPEGEGHQPVARDRGDQALGCHRGDRGGPGAGRGRHVDGDGRGDRAGARGARRLVRGAQHHPCRSRRLLRPAGRAGRHGRHRDVRVRTDDGLSRRQGGRRLHQSDRDRLSRQEPSAARARHVHVDRLSLIHI